MVEVRVSVLPCEIMRFICLRLSAHPSVCHTRSCLDFQHVFTCLLSGRNDLPTVILHFQNNEAM